MEQKLADFRPWVCVHWKQFQLKHPLDSKHLTRHLTICAKWRDLSPATSCSFIGSPDTDWSFIGSPVFHSPPSLLETCSRIDLNSPCLQVDHINTGFSWRLAEHPGNCPQRESPQRPSWGVWDLDSRRGPGWTVWKRHLSSHQLSQGDLWHSCQCAPAWGLFLGRHPNLC